MGRQCQFRRADPVRVRLNDRRPDTIITAPHGINGRGIVNVGNILYYTDANDNHVYAYNFATHTDLGTAFTVAAASALSTIAYDGTNFWIGDYSGTNHAYLYTPTGTLLKTISLANCTGHCDGLEFFNGTLISKGVSRNKRAIWRMSVW
jgi:sugar lactone lactonase YvrE